MKTNYLNPWHFEIVGQYPNNTRPISLRINIVNNNTGEIRQMTLDCEIFADMCTCEVEGIRALARKFDDDGISTMQWLGITRESCEE